MRTRITSSALLLLSALAQADCNDFYCEPQPCPGVGITCDNKSGSKIDILITKEGDGVDRVIHLIFTEPQPIGDIQIINFDSNAEILVEIRGDSDLNNPTGVDLLNAPLGGQRVVVELDANGDVGTISGFRVLRNSNIDGSVTGDILLRVPGPTFTQIPMLGHVLITGDVVGDVIVSPISLPTGPARGVAEYGLISSTVIRGTLGTLADSTVVKCAGKIRDLSVGELNSEVSGGIGLLELGGLEATQDYGGTGDINASITLYDFASPWLLPNSLGVDGTLRGDVVVRQGLPDASDPVIRVDGGVQSQIFLGTLGPFVASWDGVVEIGEISLTNPAYAQTSASIGGGAIGLVPFDVHDEDCSPVGGAIETTPPTHIRIRHYGPVIFDDTTSEKPVVFERRPRCGAPRALPVISEDCYAAAVNSDNARDLDVKPFFKMPRGFDYRITPVMGGKTPLMSDLPWPMADAPVAPYTYAFGVGGGCAENIDGMNGVDLRDLQMVLFMFSNTAYDCPPMGDVNGDLFVDLEDLQRVLAKFGTE